MTLKQLKKSFDCLWNKQVEESIKIDSYAFLLLQKLYQDNKEYIELPKAKELLFMLNVWHTNKDGFDELVAVFESVKGNRLEWSYSFKQLMEASTHADR